MRSLRTTARAIAAATALAVAPLAATTLAAAPAEAIVGGSTVEEGQYAFMASLQSKGSHGSDGHFCGGSVVSGQWVLTAAHCVEGDQPGDLQVAVGRTDLDDTGTGQTLAVDRIVVHPSYAETDTFDAALVRVTEPVEAPAIPLVPLGEESLEQDGAALTVSGWGTEFFGSPFIPATMKAVDVEAVSDASCTTNRTQGFQDASEMCAETLLGDSCQGDSGGPLFGTLADGRRVQVGIVSYGLGCATPLFPGVYAEANNTSIHDFVTSTAGL